MWKNLLLYMHQIPPCLYCPIRKKIKKERGTCYGYNMYSSFVVERRYAVKNSIFQPLIILFLMLKFYLKHDEGNHSLSLSLINLKFLGQSIFRTIQFNFILLFPFSEQQLHKNVEVFFCWVYIMDHVYSLSTLA